MKTIKFLLVISNFILLNIDINASQHNYKRNNKFIEQDIPTGFYLSPVSKIEKKNISDNLINTLQSNISDLYNDKLILEKKHSNAKDEISSLKRDNESLMNELEAYKTLYKKYIQQSDIIPIRHPLKCPLELINFIKNDNINPDLNEKYTVASEISFQIPANTKRPMKTDLMLKYQLLMQSKRNIEIEYKKLQKVIESQNKIIENTPKIISNYTIEDIINIIEENIKLKKENKVFQKNYSKTQIQQLSKNQKKKNKYK